MKKLPKALATATFLAPMGAAALGVGDIELHSALNQPLNAKIALITSHSESSSDIKVSLASPKAFNRAGIERYFYLSNIRFKPVIAADGSLSIKVTSHEIIREPFLNFLVEVNWPQGRALKEFTVLLDPPVTLREAEPVVQSSPVTHRTETKSASIRSATQRAVPSSARSGQSAVGLGVSKFGPTKRNDTLWGIATQVNNDPSISQEQMMMSLYKKNPQSFYQENVNALKRGQRLKIPTREEILQLSKREARGQFSDHYKAWTTKASVTDVDASQEEEINSGSLSAEVPQEEDQLTLLTPTDEATDSSTGLSEQDSGAGGNAEPRVDIAMEMAESVRQENEDIQKRMAALEEQVSTMQRLLVLKDEQLAVLQGSQANEAVETEEEITETGEEVESAADMAVETPKPEKAAITPPPSQETPFYEDPVYLGVGGIGLLVLGFIAIAARRKRAMEEVVAAESILVASSDSPDSKDELIIPVVDSSESEAGIPAESSFLSEFTPSDFDTLDSDNDEVDPITEADVYLAYGRYQQAEDLVRQAIENDPENEEYKLKLLEIHFATEDKDAFFSLAKEIHTDCAESNPDLWMRAVEMGQDMCPEEALFQPEEEEEALQVDGESAVEEFSFETDSEEQLSEEVSGIDDESTVSAFAVDESFEEASAESQVEDEPENIDSLEFGFSEETNEVDSGEEPENNSIEFGIVEPSIAEEMVGDATEVSLDDEIEISQAEESDDQAENDDFSFDFEMVPTDEEKGAEPAIQGEGLDLDDDIAASLTDMDEVETKLDLAKAYVDMEDAESAKGILQEIMEQGNDEQKAEAQLLIDGLK